MWVGGDFRNAYLGYIVLLSGEPDLRLIVSSQGSFGQTYLGDCTAIGIRIWVLKPQILTIETGIFLKTQNSFWFK